jgi:hypothetical protein
MTRKYQKYQFNGNAPKKRIGERPHIKRLFLDTRDAYGKSEV